MNKARTPLIVAGPCSLESRAQTLQAAQLVASLPQVAMMRCGVWKPRTRPGGFEGMGEEALTWIDEARREFPSVRFCCEVAQVSHVEAALRHGMDAVWIGARTTGNPFSVAEVAEALRGSGLPVMVKNAPTPDAALWLGAIERMEAVGLTVTAVHRGFSTYRNGGLRNNPLWEVPIELRRLRPDLPLLCDPSHIAGRRDRVAQIAHTALDMGFDGLMVECHPQPDEALTDAAQQLTPDALRQLMAALSPRSADSATAEALLHDFRSQIDEIDSQLLALLQQRMEVSGKIARVKARHNLSVVQRDRWEQLLADRLATAGAIGLAENFVKEIFEKIHAESVRVQVVGEKGG